MRLGFREFLAREEKADFIDASADELGTSRDKMLHILSTEPKPVAAAKFSGSSQQHKMAPIEILKWTFDHNGNPTGAKVKIMVVSPMQKAYVGKHSAKPEAEERWMSRKELLKAYNKDYEPSIQQAQGAGGMQPGGGGGMPMDPLMGTGGPPGGGMPPL